MKITDLFDGAESTKSLIWGIGELGVRFLPHNLRVASSNLTLATALVTFGKLFTPDLLCTYTILHFVNDLTHDDYFVIIIVIIWT